MNGFEDKDKHNDGEHRIPTIAIVGRPNVGKSSLFNVIIGRRLSIVHEESGVTRDRLTAPVAWHGKHFLLVDTGGLGTITGESRNVSHWDIGIREQVDAAIEGADILLFVVNVQEGLVPLDEEVASRLRDSGKKVFLIVNKSDNPAFEAQAVEFSVLGYDLIYPVSSLHRRGFGNLLQAMLEDVPVKNMRHDSKEPFKIALIGRPNVGKSSLANCLIGQDRVMVSDVAGTTRDSVDIDFELEYHGEKLPAALIDTAGMRKKSKVNSVVELFSMMRTKEAIDRAELILFLVEADPEGVTAQDRRIAGMISESGKACVIVANKYDNCRTIHKDDLMDELRYTLPGMTYAPVVFASALTKYNMDQLLDQIAEVMEQLEVQIPTSVVNRVVNDAILANSPPVVGRAPFKVYYSTMIGNQPPRFVLFVNNPKLCAPNYLAYLKNYLRKVFDFTGLPISVFLRERPKKVESIRTSKPRVKPVKPGSKKADKPGKIGSKKITTGVRRAKQARKAQKNIKNSRKK